jgi:hypothetical protein
MYMIFKISFILLLFIMNFIDFKGKVR